VGGFVVGGAVVGGAVVGGAVAGGVVVACSPQEASTIAVTMRQVTSSHKTFPFILSSFTYFDNTAG
jgi:propanediol dehydratase large subunit